MAEVDKHPGSTSAAKVPVIPAPTRSRANLANQAPGLGTQAAGHQTIFDPLPPRPQDEGEAPWSAKPPPGLPEQGRRRGDAAWIPIDFSDEDTAACGPLPKQRSRWRGVEIAGRIVLALVCALTGPVVRQANEKEVRGSAVIAEPTAPVVQRTELPADPDAALTTALDHLNSALEAFPERSPEQILHQVSTPREDCMLAWTNNLPSVIYGREPIGPNSLAYTLEDCAKAVSRMR